MKNEVEKNGKLVAKVSQKIESVKNKEGEPKSAIKTEIEIPSKGIHRIIKNDENVEIVQDKKEESNEESKRGKNGSERDDDEKYGPEDMAEYIFWTGDEKGVALTIQEFLRVGLMTRQEAIGFLQAIKYHLELMQLHYQRLEKADEKLSNKGKANEKRKHIDAEKFLVKSGSSELAPANTNLKGNSYADQIHVGKGHANGQEYSDQRNKSFSKFPSLNKAFEAGPDDDYDELMEKLRVAGLLQKEYSLEEVIFELAKIMFSESLTKGNPEAQKAMQRFSDFLQNQVQHNQISRNLQRKILDVLSSALMDALSEHPEQLNRSMADQIMLDQNSPTSDALKQLLMLGSKRLSGQSNSIDEVSEKTLLLEGKKLYKGVK